MSSNRCVLKGSENARYLRTIKVQSRTSKHISSCFDGYCFQLPYYADLTVGDFFDVVATTNMTSRSVSQQDRLSSMLFFSYLFTHRIILLYDVTVIFQLQLEFYIKLYVRYSNKLLFI